MALHRFSLFITQRTDPRTTGQPMRPADWTLKPERFLEDPVVFGLSPETCALMIAETATPFRRRNLFCGEVWLHSKQWDRARTD